MKKDQKWTGCLDLARTADAVAEIIGIRTVVQPRSWLELIFQIGGESQGSHSRQVYVQQLHSLHDPFTPRRDCGAPPAS